VVGFNFLNIYEAIELLDAVSNFHSKTSEATPDFCIFDNQNEGYALSVKVCLISEEYRKHLRKVAESRKLSIRESEGVITIQG
jgi:hypothetical protein